MDTSRMTAHQVQQYHNKIRFKEQELSKEQFENSLRESTNAITQSNSALYGASQNIFNQKLTKDSGKLISLNKRKHKMKEEMIDMITDLNEKEFDKFESTMMTYQLTK